MDSSQPFHEVARRGFKYYLEYVCDNNIGSVVVRDYQVIHLSSASFHPDGILSAYAADKHLNESKAMLDQWPFVGIVEKYNESIFLLNSRLQEYGFQFSLPSFHSNRGVISDSSLDGREVPSSLYEDFMSKNALDQRLYDYFLQKHIIEYDKIIN